jgi:hypothetical protein
VTLAAAVVGLDVDPSGCRIEPDDMVVAVRVAMLTNVLPPSVDLWNESSVTYTSFSSFGLTNTLLK